MIFIYIAFKIEITFDSSDKSFKVEILCEDSFKIVFNISINEDS